MTGSDLFLMLLYGWQLIEHWVLLYFQVCSNSAYPQHSGEWYRTSGPLVLETTVVYDIEVGRWSQLNECMKLYEYQRSRSFIDICQSHSDLIFSNFFSSIMARPVETKFHVEPPWEGRTKAYSNGPGHMTTMPIYGKTIKNLHLWNQKANDLETWNAALVFGCYKVC